MGSVLRYQGKIRSGPDYRETLGMACVVRLRWYGQQHKKQQACRPGAHVFNSRLSSLRKLQSVPSAMIACGLAVVMPVSFMRSA